MFGNVLGRFKKDLFKIFVAVFHTLKMYVSSLIRCYRLRLVILSDYNTFITIHTIICHLNIIPTPSRCSVSGAGGFFRPICCLAPSNLHPPPPPPEPNCTVLLILSPSYPPITQCIIYSPCNQILQLTLY